MTHHGIDAGPLAATIGAIGREDRALLRNNPSARTDAGTGAGVRTPSDSRTSSLFWPQSDKPRGSGGRAPSSNRLYRVTIVKIFRASGK